MTTASQVIPVDLRLGTGWAFPPEPDGHDHHLAWRSGPGLVRQSILLILDTEPGERVMRPTFGCGLRRFLMEPNIPSTRAAIAREIEGALRTWEARVQVRKVDVTVTDDPSIVLIAITYTHVRDQSVAAIEVPFTLASPSGGS